ncbi:UPF0149 family protein, partial [Ferrovum myxofaciens]
QHYSIRDSPMNVNQPLTDDEINELDDFLLSDKSPGSCMDISTFDGFLAAVVLNPDVILPSHWLPWVWDMDNGEESPEFDTLDEASRISNLIMRHYNTVATTIDEDRFGPLLFVLPQPDNSEFYDAEGWCEGFMLGAAVFLEPWWRSIMKDRTELVAPMVLLGTEPGWEILSESADEKRAIQEAYESIPDVIEALHTYFEPLRMQAIESRIGNIRTSNDDETQPFRRSDAKVGRNDPCPCGSGKKFKKCCGSDELFH